MFAMYVCVCVFVCREVEEMQLCYFAVRHVNWTKTCDLTTKLSFLTYRGKHHIISLLYSFFKYNIRYVVISSFFQKNWSVPKTSLI